MAGEASELQLCEIVANILVTISKGEQILQCIREVLVTNNLFAPMNLFKYLSFGNASITRKNLLQFLDENSLVKDEKEAEDFLARMFSRIGIQKGNRMAYTEFLNYVYPFNSSILRDVLTNKFKNYEQIQKVQKNSRPDKTVLTGFLLLLQEQIELERKVDAQIADPRFPGKDKIRKVLKSIKKASDKMSKTVTQNSPNHISSLQLRNFIRAFLDVPQHLFLYLGRKLGMDKQGQIPLDNLEQYLKKTKRHLSLENENIPKNDDESYRIDQSDKKQIRELNYREQLYKELANTLKAQNNRTPRDKSLSEYRAVSEKKQQNHTTPTKAERDFLMINQNEKVAKEKQKDRAWVHLVFKDFVEAFLRSNKQVQKCKSRLSQLKIDFLALFKSLDKGRGMIDVKDLERFYLDLSGIPIEHDFQLLVERHAVAEERWLSYSEFMEIFKSNSSGKAENQQDESLQGSLYRKDNCTLSPEAMRLMSQTIYLSLEMEYVTKKILSVLNQIDKEWLFSEINIDSESKGFINYQELKRYLTGRLKMNLSMVDLMTLLKRLDRGRNGVVVKEQFLYI